MMGFKERSAVRWTKLAAALGLMIAVCGCAELVIGSAVMGTLAAVDRRTVGAQTDDKVIAVKAENRISQRYGSAMVHVNVTSYNRKVLLTGEVHEAPAKLEVERVVGEVENVRSIVNDLEVAGNSSLTSRSSDALITGKVKASLVEAKDISATTFKVVTERGVVYLMGLVTEQEGARAAEVARNVGGVQKVVKVFEYVSAEELERMNTAVKAGASTEPSSTQ